MEITEAVTLAETLIDKHGLVDWSFKLNSARRQLGVCKETVRRIELSRHFVTNNTREHVVDTILHEIAHALVGTEHGHGAVWKAMCLRLGCTPKSCEKSVIMPEGQWKAECPSCLRIFSLHRRPKYIYSLYCRKCGPDSGKLRFSNQKQTYRKRVEKSIRQEAAQLMLKLF
jgi:predicted SprT family Zn-dependent metalloprotease